MPLFPLILFTQLFPITYPGSQKAFRFLFPRFYRARGYLNDTSQSRCRSSALLKTDFIKKAVSLKLDLKPLSENLLVFRLRRGYNQTVNRHYFTQLQEIQFHRTQLVNMQIIKDIY